MRSTDFKTSFEPIENSEITILILGTLPSDKSLEVSEYYGHSGNRFWKIIAALTANPLPLTYPEKKELLLKNGIGIWDIVQQAKRNGSLDTSIKNEEPNDLNTFIENHKLLKVIGFNGKKSEALFNKYFERKKDFRYISLPSSSPANAGINFENICKVWQQIIT